MIIAAEDLDRLLSVAVATIGFDGALIDGNAGFVRAFGLAAGTCRGSPVGCFFIHPNWATLSRAVPGEAGEVFSGLMTVGDRNQRMRSLRGRVWREADRLCLVAEYDVVELERIADIFKDLSHESIMAQRALGTENVVLKRHQAEMIETSLTDPLTGVGNRRKLDDALAAEISGAARSGQPLSVAMADLDHFKRVNDGFGHAVGDEVLARFGDLLRMQTRQTDIVARFGGEEFVVLMPHTYLSQAMEVADRIRGLLANERIGPLPEAVTVSFGVAEYISAETAATFLHRVDEALYRAKRSGRNRVEPA
jgi:two-component system cell cycle response regulator